MNKSRIDIILIRHGETRNNAEGRLCGRADYPLTEAGKDFIRDMVAKYPYDVPERIYCSPASRCITTANLSFPGRELEVIEDLQEADFGEFEERLASELFDLPEYKGVEEQRLDYCFPGGESFGSLRDRAVRVFHDVITRAAQENSRCIAIITHSCLMAQVLKAMLKEDQIEGNPLFSPTGMAPNGMGISLYVKPGESTLDRPLNFNGYLPVGAPLPDMSKSPYFRDNTK